MTSDLLLDFFIKHPIKQHIAITAFSLIKANLGSMHMIIAGDAIHTVIKQHLILDRVWVSDCNIMIADGENGI